MLAAPGQPDGQRDVQVMCDDVAVIDMDVVESTFRSSILHMFPMKKYALPHMEKGDL